jgi:hypothetical protein
MIVSKYISYAVSGNLLVHDSVRWFLYIHRCNACPKQRALACYTNNICYKDSKANIDRYIEYESQLNNNN